mmetsp:Transcript_26868/g.57058  ORF Transcript_26868/g.57058 Transcript_26868/m.57058 type:complete len:213 (+) Transcript_26868:503-1141(+)
MAVVSDHIDRQQLELVPAALLLRLNRDDAPRLGPRHGENHVQALAPNLEAVPLDPNTSAREHRSLEVGPSERRAHHVQDGRRRVHLRHRHAVQLAGVDPRALAHIEAQPQRSSHSDGQHPKFRKRFAEVEEEAHDAVGRPPDVVDGDGDREADDDVLVGGPEAREGLPGHSEGAVAHVLLRLLKLGQRSFRQRRQEALGSVESALRFAAVRR